MTTPTQITTPGGTRLTVPLAWTCWTHKGQTFRRLPDGGIRLETRRFNGVLRWTGQRWEPVQAPARFLGVS